MARRKFTAFKFMDVKLIERRAILLQIFYVCHRKRLYISNPDVPTSTNDGSIVDSRSDQFLLFTHSDIDADAAQTTVPFLDAQPVAPDPPTLLAGAGIYHKGRSGYGGFIGPKVVTYDFNDHIQATFPITDDEVN
jgi:hypothetical protein